MNRMLGKLRDEKGMTVILVAGITVMFMAFAALSVDIAHLYVVQNELQRAADAGALAGGRRLYYHDGSAVNTDANQIAYEAAIENNSEKIAVEVQLPNTNTDDVQRGHWSFTTRTFTPSNRTTIPDLWNATTAELDADLTFVNAIKIRTRRQQTQANSFFARVVGFTGFNVSAEAIAYIGYAGAIPPLTLDQPIAVCKQSIINNSNEYSCTTGRMMTDTHDTAAWSNLSQPCETATPPSIAPLICDEAGANKMPLLIGRAMGIDNGQDNSGYMDVYECWKNDSSLDTDGDGIADKSWQIVLPVINCCPDGVSNCTEPTINVCMKFVGIVEIDVLWISRWGVGNVKGPKKMDDWTCPAGNTDAQCWASFVQHFNLRNYDGSYPELRSKSI